MTRLRAAWDARTARERIALGTGSVALALLLAYALIWEPVHAEQKRLRESLPLLRAQATQLAADAAEAKRLRGLAQAPVDASTPRAALAAAADRAGVRPSIRSITEASAGRVQLVVDPLAYDALVRWIGELTRTPGFAVESLILGRASASGTVLVQTLVLKRIGTP